MNYTNHDGEAEAVRDGFMAYNAANGAEPVDLFLMLGDNAAPAVPMSKVIGQEIESYGSHGMQAHRYGAMLDMVRSGKLFPERLVGREIRLDDAPEALMNMDKFQSVGATVITQF